MPGFPIRNSAMLAALLVIAAVRIALAGQPPADTSAPAKPPGPVVTEIVVAGSRPAVENRIDRKVYAISGDLQSDLGSAADALRNIPSVSVDLDGVPSLRGDADVQILIDGRYRPEFNGTNRGEALQQLAANGVDRIEVITNPPANFKREGSAGIINIITRRPLGARSASAQASLGSGDRYNVSTSQGAQLGKLNLHGSAAVRHDRRIRDITGQRVVRDAAGNLINEREQQTSVENDRVTKKISLGADYDLNTTDRLSAEGTYYRLDVDTGLEDHTQLQDAAGVLSTQYGREQHADTYEYSSDVMLRFHHAGKNEDDGLTVAVERSEDPEHRSARGTYSFTLPAQEPLLQNQRWIEDAVATEMSVDYTATLSAKRRFAAGYDLQLNDDSSDNSQTIPVNTGGVGVPDPDFTNQFRSEQTVHALYVTYEQPLAAWTFLAGLRLEQSSLDLEQVTSGERSSQEYFRAYPSLHLARKLNEQQTLTFSYARRVQRPFLQDMNPYPLQYEANQFNVGNPDLRPSEIDSLEAGWSYDAAAASFSASVYERRTHDSVSYVTTLLSPTATLTRPENVGETRSGGFELTASGKLGARFGYNLSGEVYYSEIDAENLAFTGTRSTFSGEAKAALNWRIGEKDRMQINLAAAGKQLTPQGYRLGSSTMDLGYRHQFRPGLALTATLSDVFATRRDRLVLETPELSQHLTTQPNGRIAWLGVSWTLVKGSDKPPDDFEYEK
jgi:outer membrane receptor protein involved in Fe transport